MSVYTTAATIAFNLSCPRTLQVQKFVDCGIVSGRWSDGTAQPLEEIKAHIFNQQMDLVNIAVGTERQLDESLILNTTTDLETTFDCNFDLGDTSNPDNCPLYIIDEYGSRYRIHSRIRMPKAHCLYYYNMRLKCETC